MLKPKIANPPKVGVEHFFAWGVTGCFTTAWNRDFLAYTVRVTIGGMPEPVQHARSAQLGILARIERMRRHLKE
jgi:hypothetical protein